MDLIIGDFTETLCRELCKKIKHSVLFIDRNMMECIHWNGGFSKLLSAGVKWVKEFSPFEKAPDSCTKAVFLTSSLITNESVRKTIKMIIDNSNKCLDYCLLVTAASYQCHLSAVLRFRSTTAGVEFQDGRRIFSDFENQMLLWMGSKSFTSEVVHIPLFLGHLAEDVFLTLPFADVAPSLENGSFHSDFYRLKFDQQIMVDIFSSCFNSLLAALNVKEDIYCVGPFSSLIGTHLVNLVAAKNRRKTATNQASLLLIDRTADLVAPLVCLESSALDQILYSNKIFDGHRNERVIEMPEKNMEHFPCFTVFEHCKNPEASNLLQQFIEKPIHDCIGLAENKLIPFLKKYAITLPKNKQLSCDQALVQSINSLLNVESFDLPPYFQVCSSLLAPIEDSLEISKSIEILSEIELIYVLPDALAKFIQFSEEKTLSFDFDVKCLILLYSLAAGNSLSWSTSYIESFLVSKLRRERPNDVIFAQTGAHVVVQSVLAKLKNVARLRDVIPSQKPSTPYIVNLLERIFDHRQLPLPELACKTGGLADVFKSSLSLLMNVTKASRPSDAETVIIFVVGGICCWEIAAVRRKLLEMKIINHNVILGSTQLLTANDVLGDFLVNMSDCDDEQ